MADLPISVETALEDPAYARANPAVVACALSTLGCAGAKTFRAFYERYAGPFGGSGGYELLDIAEGPETIVTQTEAARTRFAFPPRYLVISTYVGNAVLVYDCQTDCVFDVDFEGSERELIAGTLAPRWHSFEELLVELFA